MASGMEIAGLALAIFPLVIEGLEFYASSARKIKELWRYKLSLNRLISDLDTEKCKFENTCTSLLEDIVSDTDLTLLMDDPGGALWEADRIQEKLKCRLRPATVQCYMGRIKELRSSLETLGAELKLYQDDMVYTLPY